MTHEEIVALEALIDRYGLSAVLATIAQTCTEKAEHLEVNWQDRGTASVWANASVLVEAVSISVGKNSI